MDLGFDGLVRISHFVKKLFEVSTTLVINRFYVGKTTKGVVMGMESVLQSIKNAEESALAKIAASKEEAAKILADARKEASEIIQGAQDGAVSSTVATLDSARTKAGKELRRRTG